MPRKAISSIAYGPFQRACTVTTDIKPADGSSTNSRSSCHDDRLWIEKINWQVHDLQIATTQNILLDPALLDHVLIGGQCFTARNFSVEGLDCRRETTIQTAGLSRAEGMIAISSVNLAFAAQKALCKYHDHFAAPDPQPIVGRPSCEA